MSIWPKRSWMGLLRVLAPGPLRCLGSFRINGITKRTKVTWADNVANQAAKVQSYVSRSDDPYLNLSIEHFLLEKSPPESTVLFLYVNRPCVVIGRNQNPWLEVNLSILNAAQKANLLETEPPGLGKVDLVRRRSGGGTVFHDAGNVNWTVICPPADFTRDKHAEMVVRALRSNGVERARVNERHDIVLDQGLQQEKSPDPSDLHRTPYTVDVVRDGRRPIKVSGSAYKLTKRRALHHGTCLLSSPNLNIIPQYLHSPARPYLKAKGVESVSSPVGNIGLDIDVFKKSVREEFKAMYLGSGEPNIDETLGKDALEVEAIKKLWLEMQTIEWTFSQTPQFEFSSHPTSADERDRPALPGPLPPSLRVHLESRHGLVTKFAVSNARGAEAARGEGPPSNDLLKEQSLYGQDWTWVEAVERTNIERRYHENLASWLQTMLPLGLFKA